MVKTPVMVVLLLGLVVAVATGCGDDEATGVPAAGAAGAPGGESGGGGETDAGANGGSARGGTDGEPGHGGEAGSGHTNGGDGGAAGAGKAGNSATAGAAGESGAGGATSGDCEIGRRAEAVFDERGGSLELCGAEVTMPPGVLDEPRMVTLSIVDLPPGAPDSLAQGGPAFAVDVEGELPTDGGAPLSVIVPHIATTRYVYFYVYAADTWNFSEACTQESERIGQEAWTEGVFVALIETEDFPATVTGLGSGSVEVSFDGATSTFDLDADTIETHAIYDGSEDGRTVTLSATKEASDSSLERLRIDFAIDAEGAASLTQITYGSTADVNGFWSYLPFFPQNASVELSRDSDGELAGTVSTELTRGEMTSPFSASFAVVVEKYRYPPEGYCNVPEG